MGRASGTKGSVRTYKLCSGRGARLRVYNMSHDGRDRRVRVFGSQGGLSMEKGRDLEQRARTAGNRGVEKALQRREQEKIGELRVGGAGESGGGGL